MSTPRGQGRKTGNKEAFAKQVKETGDRAMRFASKPTDVRRPDWMADPSLLPKRPPTAQKEGAR